MSEPAASAPPANPGADHPSDPAQIVRRYLEASMAPDPATAARYVADDVVITFTGGRVFRDPAGPAAFNAARYRSVQKKMERFDVVPRDPVTGETVVYSVGTLYGAWPDGEPFEGNRYVDRFVVRDGRIIRMDVWNDSAERLLARAGLAEL